MLAGDPAARPSLREILESDPWINAPVAALPIASATFEYEKWMAGGGVGGVVDRCIHVLLLVMTLSPTPTPTHTHCSELAGKGEFSSTARMARRLNVDPDYLASTAGAETLMAEEMHQETYTPIPQNVHLTPSIGAEIYLDISRFEIAPQHMGATAGTLM